MDQDGGFGQSGASCLSWTRQIHERSNGLERRDEAFPSDCAKHYGNP